MSAINLFLLLIVIGEMTFDSVAEANVLTVRYPLTKTTWTSTTYLTTLATCVETTSCAVTLGHVTPCRRRKRTRRPPIIDVDAIFPSIPFRFKKIQFNILSTVK